MCNEDVIYDIPPFNESILKGGDEGIHKRLKSIDYNFGNDFVNHIAKTNGPKMINIVRKRNFWDESDASMI